MCTFGTVEKQNDSYLLGTLPVRGGELEIPPNAAALPFHISLLFTVSVFFKWQVVLKFKIWIVNEDIFFWSRMVVIVQYVVDFVIISVVIQCVTLGSSCFCCWFWPMKDRNWCGIFTLYKFLFRCLQNMQHFDVLHNVFTWPFHPEWDTV